MNALEAAEAEQLRAEVQGLRRTLGKVLTLYVDLLLDQKLDDGSSVLGLALAMDPDLAARLRAVLQPRPQDDFHRERPWGRNQRENAERRAAELPNNQCLLRIAHKPHDWWYTSSGGGHMLVVGPGGPTARDRETERNLKQHHCRGMCRSLAFGDEPDNYGEHWCVLEWEHPMECRDETHWWRQGRHPRVHLIATNLLEDEIR